MKKATVFILLVTILAGIAMPASSFAEETAASAAEESAAPVGQEEADTTGEEVKRPAAVLAPGYEKDPATGVWRVRSCLDTRAALIKRLSGQIRRFIREFAVFGVPAAVLKAGESVSDAPEKECTATVMFVGDLMCLRAQQNAAKTGVGRWDFRSSFSLVKPIFAEADLNVGNLETLISPSTPLTSEQLKCANGNSLCNGPEDYLKAVKYAGFDAVVMANNHSCDGCADGIRETLERVDRYGFAHTGTFMSGEKRYVLIDVNGIRLAILSTTHIMNQRVLMGELGLDEFVYDYSAENVRGDIAAARNDGADFVVVYCHWGNENTHTLISQQKEAAIEIANAGADLIIGSHPHCLQEAQYITADDGRSVLCMYSMGNFVSSMPREINNDTIILRTEITLRDGKAQLTDASYIPCHVFPSMDGKKHLVTPVSERLNGGIRSGELRATRERVAALITVIPEYE